MPVRAVFAVAVAGVVDHLVFGAGGFRALLDDEVFDAVVAFWGDFPFPGEDVVPEFLPGHDVAARDIGGFHEDAVLDFPAESGILFGAEPAEIGKILAVEQELPAIGFLLRGEGVDFLGEDRKGEQEQEQVFHGGG